LYLRVQTFKGDQNKAQQETKIRDISVTSRLERGRRCVSQELTGGLSDWGRQERKIFDLALDVEGGEPVPRALRLSLLPYRIYLTQERRGTVGGGEGEEN